MSINKRLVEEERTHRDEMNLIEFPIGIADRRVPIDQVTGLEVVEIRFDSFITDGGVRKEQHWVARGDRGLPRGDDLDIFTAIMTEWSKSDFQNRLVSLGSTYSILKMTGKDATQTKSYRRFYKGIDRLYGLSIETNNAIWDWNAQQRLGKYKFRIFSSVGIREAADEQTPRGFVRVTEEFYALIQKGFLKFTNIERYWRLPDTYSRRLFQYLDKHRRRALREGKGKHEIGGYLLLKKLGTLDQTLKRYDPCKVRTLLTPRVEALVADGYLSDFRWKKGGQGRSPIFLEVTFTPDAPDAPVPLKAEEAEAIDLIGKVLGEPENRAYHTRVVRDLGHKQARALLVDVEAGNARNRAALFTHLVKNAERHRGR
jgi:hypothetical protein